MAQIGLARAQVVTADAFQVYEGLNIGTAKPTMQEQEGVPHHLIDIRQPGERFTVADWLAEAHRAIAAIKAAGHLPIVVGGTHLYIKSFLEGMFEGPAEDPQLRAQLAALPPEELRARLERVDPAAAAKLHRNDLRRTIRALEVHRLTGTPISELQRQWDQATTRRTDCVLVGIEWPPEELNRRVTARVKDMVTRGLVAEVESLWKAGRLIGQAREALGYKQLIEAFEGRCSVADAVERIKIDTRHLAKAQRTWMRRLRSIPGSVWIDASAQPSDRWANRVIDACQAAGRSGGETT
jgi:tRNA dimethylallyltransferase